MTDFPLRAGYASVEWTPEPGLELLGQMHKRYATHARDPLMAVAVAYANADQTVVIVAVDTCILDTEFVRATQQLWQQRSGLAAASLLVHTTHTHVSPVATPALRSVPDPVLLVRLQNAVLEAASQALAKLEPVQLFSASGHCQQMGWNRRAMYEDGTSRMYGNSTQPGFSGMEGPRDGELPLMWTRNQQGEVTGVLVNFATHPNCLEGESFYSADIPGAVRNYLGRLLGGNAQVIYMTGAAGNTAPSILDPFQGDQPWRGDVGVERSGQYLAGEAAKTIAATLVPIADPALKRAHRELKIPLRPYPTKSPFGKEQSWNKDMLAYYDQSEAEWPDRLAKCSPFSVAVNVLRLGDTVICTNPAELFVEFGLAIKAASPARVTVVTELTDGYCGYVPTKKAFERGGYETWTAPTSQLDPCAGEKIVEATVELLGELFS